MKYIEEMSRKGISYKKYNSDFGAKILGKFGWKEGEGLGKTKSGITEAIQIKRREENIGLGKTKKDVVWNDKWWEQSYDNILKDMKKITNDEKNGYNLRNSNEKSERKNSEEKIIKKRKNSTNSKGGKKRKESINSMKKERKNSLSSNHKKEVNKKERKNSKDNLNNNNFIKKKRKITFIDI